MLTLLKERVKRTGNYYWHNLYLCDCGKEYIVRAADVRNGHVTSCGCKKGNHSHGLSHTGEYSSWRSMIRRCESPTCASYKYYGGRGITVCDEWKELSNFCRDMGPRPPGTSIDRINNDLGYFKENCRWADQKTQNLNRRKSKKSSSFDQ